MTDDRSIGPLLSSSGGEAEPLQSALARKSFEVVHRRRDLLAVTLLVLHSDHGAEREVGPSHDAGGNGDLRAVVEHHPVGLQVHDAPLHRGRGRPLYSRAGGDARAQGSGEQRKSHGEHPHQSVLPPLETPELAFGRYFSGTPSRPWVQWVTPLSST